MHVKFAMISLLVVGAGAGVLDDLVQTLFAGGEAYSGGPQPMKVIGAGYGRTGTDSLRLALNALGFRTYHMREAVEAGDVGRWAAVRTDAQKTEMITRMASQGFNATVDFPASVLYPDLMAAYPDGKVILGVRDSAEAWASSYCSTIGRIGALMARTPFQHLPGLRGFAGIDDYLELHTHIERTAQGQPVFESARGSYTRWVAAVQAAVPADRLLVHNAKQGWPPLCRFLGLASDDCPSTPYPRVNGGAEFGNIIDAGEFVADHFVALLALLIVLVVVLPMWVLYQACKCRQARPKAKRL